MNKTYQYQCDNCEDIEDSHDIRDPYLCECGDWRYLVKHNKYDEHDPKCRKCKNYGSIECFDCLWYVIAQGGYSK